MASTNFPQYFFVDIAKSRFLYFMEMCGIDSAELTGGLVLAHFSNPDYITIQHQLRLRYEVIFDHYN
jgi:hypothetical protein